MTKKERFDRLSGIGCIICREFYGVFSQALIHHLIGLEFRSTGKKASDDNTIGLCYNHHVSGSIECPSIHSHPKEFERRFGTQRELLDLTNELINYRKL